MSNGFVRYMNSMNNADGDTSNALAEAQVDNLYYKEIQVDRQLGKYIVEEIKQSQKKAYIITGHAGDGKTSILVQVLRDLDMLGDGDKLQVRGEISLDSDTKLIYIKDMSELPKEQQVLYMREILEAPKNGNIGIMISNTGPLITTYKEVVRLLGGDFNEDEVENFLLEQLDLNEDKEKENNGYSFYLINLARLDNTWFAPKIIEKITNEKLWVECEQCNRGAACPIYSNYKHIKKNQESVSNFIEDYYCYLYEQDKRMTIRQIVSHISYALTGNLECSKLNHVPSNKYTPYIYNFANLFFGYKGIHEQKNALQVKSISELQYLKLDRKALEQEYDILIRNDFSRFTTPVKEIVESYWNSVEAKFAIDNSQDNEKEKINEERLRYRQSLRRFMLMYTYNSIDKEGPLRHQVFGSMFEKFKTSLGERLSKQELKAFHNVIFNALYINYMGTPPCEKSMLYITLRREDKVIQNILLLLGEAKAEDIEVKQRPISNKFEDSKNGCMSIKYELYLQFKNDEHILDFPLLNYFYGIAKGAVYGKIKADLTHGLAKLNTKLLKAFKDKDEFAEFKLLVNEGEEPVRVRFEIMNNRLYVD